MTQTLDRIREAIRGELGEFTSPSKLDAAARAVLAAMRKPTEAMLEAGEEAHASSCGYQYAAIEEVWEAMIEEAGV